MGFVHRDEVVVLIEDVKGEMVEIWHSDKDTGGCCDHSLGLKNASILIGLSVALRFKSRPPLIKAEAVVFSTMKMEKAVVRHPTVGCALRGWPSFETNLILFPTRMQSFVASILLVFGILTGVNTCMTAQDVQVKASFYGLEEGLSHRHVTSFYQDSTGFIWVGTRHGLNRFDGYHFQWFTTENSGLQENEVDFLLPDPQGRLWIMHTAAPKIRKLKNISLFNPNTLEFSTVQDVFGNAFPFRPDEVICFGRGPQNQLVFLTDSELITYNGVFKKQKHNLKQLEYIFDIYWAQNGQFWLIQNAVNNKDGKVVILDEKGQLVQHMTNPGRSYFQVYKEDETGVYYSTCQYSGALDQASTEWFYRDPDGVIYSDIQAKQLLGTVGLSQYFESAKVNKFKEHFWGSTTGLKFFIVPVGEEKPIDLSADYPYLEVVTTTFQDNGEHVWVGTHFGLYCFTLSRPQFKTFLAARKSNAKNRIRAMRGLAVSGERDQSLLWGWEEQKGTLWSLDLSTGQEKAEMNMGDARYALHRDRQGNLLFVGDIHSNELIRLNPATKQTIQRIPFERPDESWGIWFIHEDKYGKIWYHEPVKKEMAYIHQGKTIRFPNWTKTDGPVYLYHILEDATDTAWVASNYGVYCMNIRTGQIIQSYSSREKGSHFLPHDNIQHFTRLEDGTFWLATADAGLLHWSPETGIQQQLTRVDGLPDANVYAVYPDGFGKFWISTNEGLAFLDPASRQIRSYSKFDGLSENEFNRLSHAQAKNGTLFFGSLDGVSSLEPDKFLLDTSSKMIPLVIASFEQSNRSTGQVIDKTLELRSSGRIILQPDDIYFRLEFALLSFEDVQDVTYSYLLSPLDKKWVYQKENFIRIGALPYGKYTLRIRAQAANGTWSDKELKLAVDVLKPFYLKGWFLILSGLFFMGIVVWIVRQRLTRVKRENAILEEMVQQRTATIEAQNEKLKTIDQAKSRFFTNVSHELRTPLTLLLGPVNSLLKEKEITGRQKGLLEVVRRTGKQMLHLVNEILDLSKLEMGKLDIHSQPTELRSYFVSFLAQFQSLADDRGINFQTKLDVPEDLIILLDREKSRQVLYNLLANAFKFTPAGGSVQVRLQVQQSILELKVADSGRGIPEDDLPHIFDRYFQTNQSDRQAEGGTGIGLNLCKEYVELFGGSISVISVEGEGSTFEISIPIQETTESTIEGQQLNDVSFEDSERTIEPDHQRSKTNLAMIGKVVDSCPDSDKPTILVVEDHPDLQVYIRMVLTPEYCVHTASNGKIASDLISKVAPDLILSDLMMPVMDGYQFLDWLKSSADTCSIPVIMLTARAEQEDKLKTLQIGVDDYLTKPFDEDELLARIANLLSHQRVRSHSILEEAAGKDTEQNELAKPDREWLQDFEAYVREHLNDDTLSVPVLAAHFAMSESTLLRQLKRVVGLTPVQYLQEVRLSNARQLLENKSYRTVAEISAAVGYADARSFSRSFKKRFGKTPSGYFS